MTSRRLAAVLALVAGLGTVAGALVVAVQAFPRGLEVLAVLVAGVLVGLWGLLRRGRRRVLGLSVAGLALVGAVLLVLTGGQLVEQALLVLGAVVCLAATKATFRTRRALPTAARPLHPVLFMNPWSGGGKAERFSLAAEARARGIEAVALSREDDLEKLVRDAVARGADALAAAGGDGTQAVVATVAAELDLPYACVPAGTRNHFALDLGVDRDDVVGALDAFVDGGEHRVDLGEVNGRTFVNNVSLGVYAEAVQRAGYRDAKLRTLLDTVPDVVGPDGPGTDLRWTEPDGREHRAGAVILVSNNRYRLGHAVGSGTRPRIDDGLLGVAVVAASPPGTGRRDLPWRSWAVPAFEVDAQGPVPAGLDGEAVVLQPPVRFRVRPGVLRARIARHHPGASPSAGDPEGLRDAVAAVARVAAGRDTGAG